MTVILPGGIGQLYAPPAVSTWDPANSSPQAAGQFTNGNKTLSPTVNAAGNYSTTRGTIGRNSGKRYFEITYGGASPFTNGGVSYGAGVVTSAFVISNTNFPGLDANGISALPYASTTGGQLYGFYYNALSVPSGCPSWASGSLTAGDVVMVAVDFTTGNVYLGGSKQNDSPVNFWNNNGAGGTTPTTADAKFTAGTTMFPCVAITISSGALSTATLNGAGPFKYAAPSGFTAWG